ncbi:Outer membrane protein [Archangium gephyra]|nr:Outer membrane protein [Archangium gephyra]
MAAELPAGSSQGLPFYRYEPTPAGESSIMVDVPRFGTNVFSVGFNLNYSHRPLVLGVENDAGEFQTLRVLIEHQLVGHVDLAARFCDCTTFSLSLPVAWMEQGKARRTREARFSVLNAAASALEPLSGDFSLPGVEAGDPRLGWMLRLYGWPSESPFSVSMGGYLWVPLRGLLSRTDASARGFRAMPRLVFAGYRHHIQWSLAGAFLFRPEASQSSLPALDGSVEGSELQAGTHVSYTDKERGFSVGPEVQLSTVLIPRDYAFKPFYTSLDVLLGLHVRLSPVLQAQLAAGAGLLRRAGSPDFRFLLRVSYNPEWKRADREAPHGAPGEVPPGGVDRDADGVLDLEDACPDTPVGRAPEPSRPGCPASAPARTLTAPPLSLALCGEMPPRSGSPGSLVLGCPAGDRDEDTVFDSVDECPDSPRGEHPDPVRPGCPASDRDQDTVPDAEDACPEQPGAPALERDRSGCPGLVEVKGDRLLIRRPIVFASNTDTVLSESFPVLRALAEALQASPWIKKVRIEGHTDNQGTVTANRTLSVRRARSVLLWLQTHGVEPARLESAGYGHGRPVTGNDTDQGRAANRRVDIVIIDPPPAPSSGERP